MITDTPARTPLTRRRTLRRNGLIAGFFGVALGAGFAQAGQEYEFHIVTPLWDESSTSTSILTDVLDNGVALGTSTVRVPTSTGYRIIDETISWSVADGGSVRAGLDAWNNRGDEVIGAANGDWATIEFADQSEEQIFAFPGDVAIRPSLITEEGLVAGCSVRQGSISQGSMCVGFYWTLDAGLVHLRDSGLAPEAVNVWAANVNGEMVGVSGNGLFADNQAFYFDSRTGEHISLHPLLVNPGNVGVRSDAADINNDGVVVGRRNAGFGGDIRGFTWSRDGGAELLPVALTNPRAINNNGVIVGSKWRYTPGEGVVDLHTLADTGSFTIADARDISNTGVIVGWGWREGSSLSTGFMLVPIDGLVADINGDGVVDTADLGLLIDAFGTSRSGADLNGDGVVDTADLGQLISAFTAP